MQDEIAAINEMLNRRIPRALEISSAPIVYSKKKNGACLGQVRSFELATYLW